MNRFALSLTFISSLIFLFSCTSNDTPNTSSENNQSNDSLTSSDSLSYNPDILLVSDIPQTFYYQDKCFVMDTDISIGKNDITSFFGYFINEEDLNKWKEIDKSDDIVYVIDTNNSIYNYDLTGEFTNRFELFLTKNSNEIALQAHGSYLLYRNI